MFVFVYSNIDDAKWYTAQRYLPKGIIKNYNVIINETNFYDQSIDCDTKRWEEMRKLTTGQGEDYTTRFLLDYEYSKNH